MKEISLRYANALYDLSGHQQELILSELRSLEEVLTKNKEVQSFFASPLVRDSKKEAFLKSSLKDKSFSKTTYSFVLTLAQKGRVNLLPEVIDRFQARSDKDHGLVRGEVRSVKDLTSEEKQKIEKALSKTIGKKIILNYVKDPNIMGGLVAKVGSYTLDDTIASHLKKLNDDLQRRTH